MAEWVLASNEWTKQIEFLLKAIYPVYTIIA